MARIAIGSMKNDDKNERQTVLKYRINGIIQFTFTIVLFNWFNCFARKICIWIESVSWFTTSLRISYSLLEKLANFPYWNTFHVVRSTDILDCKSKFGKFGWNCVKDTIKCFLFRKHFQKGFWIPLKIWKPSNDSIIQTLPNTHYTHI